MSYRLKVNKKVTKLKNRLIEFFRAKNHFYKMAATLNPLDFKKIHKIFYLFKFRASTFPKKKYSFAPPAKNDAIKTWKANW
jgi:hypothetical protein